MITTPETTTASNPTYTTNDFYVVKGGVYDAKGVKSVTVNGVAATLRKNDNRWIWSATVSGFDAIAYSSAYEVPRYSVRRTIKTVKVEDKISPISTAHSKRY